MINFMMLDLAKFLLHQGYMTEETYKESTRKIKRNLVIEVCVYVVLVSLFGLGLYSIK